MTALIINWCKIMFTQNANAIRVHTATCQGGAVSTWRRGMRNDIEMISSHSLFPQDPTVHLEENIVYLNRREASFVNKEVNRLLKAKIAETKRKKKAGVPLPPEPGKIAYAVYQ